MTDTTPHSIRLTIDHQFGISHKFKCTAPVGASCRLVCPDGCEEFSVADHVSDMVGDEQEFLVPITDEERADIVRRHTLVDSGECNLLLFLENDEAELYELYEGDVTEARSGAILLKYNGDYVAWSYAAPSQDDALAEDTA